MEPLTGLWGFFLTTNTWFTGSAASWFGWWMSGLPNYFIQGEILGNIVGVLIYFGAVYYFFSNTNKPGPKISMIQRLIVSLVMPAFILLAFAIMWPLIGGMMFYSVWVFVWFFVLIFWAIFGICAWSINLVF